MGMSLEEMRQLRAAVSDSERRKLQGVYDVTRSLAGQPPPVESMVIFLAAGVQVSLEDLNAVQEQTCASPACPACSSLRDLAREYRERLRVEEQLARSLAESDRRMLSRDYVASLERFQARMHAEVRILGDAPEFDPEARQQSEHSARWKERNSGRPMSRFSLENRTPAAAKAGNTDTNQPENTAMSNTNGKTLAEIPQQFSAAEIVHHGEKLVLPEGMTLPQAQELLRRREEYMGQQTSINEQFESFPWDGAAALEAVMVRRYGWAPQTSVPGFWSDNPATTIAVEVGLGQVRQVPWGRFKLPNVSGYVETGMSRLPSGRIVFSVQAQCLRSDEVLVRGLLDDLRAELRANSIYRGKAVRVQFHDSDGDDLPMPVVKFLDTAVDQSLLVYSRAVQDAIETNLFTPLQRLEDCERAGIPFKRGVLLGGTYGTGKTLAAKVASKLAVEAGITFVYISQASELAKAVEFARLYQTPACAIFCEDIDRVMDGERDAEMDTILNTIDGIDGKASRIMVILTTNALESINPAMLRPGRLDAVIEVTAPDAEAVQKLLRVYGGAMIADTEDLSEAGAELSGQVPAVIAEVVKRAKLSQLRRQAPGQPVTSLSGQALAESARTMARQVALLNPPAAPAREQPSLQEVIVDAVRAGLNGSIEAIHSTAERVKEIHAETV